MNWTTTAVKESWKSPDGKVTIWEVKNSDGKLEQTMSQAIATHGWSGQIEAYTNDKNKRYIRQAKKEEFRKSDSEGMAWGNSLTNATNLHISLLSKLELDSVKVDEIQRAIIDTAEYFYNNRPGKQPLDQPLEPNLPSRDINEDLDQGHFGSLAKDFPKDSPRDAEGDVPYQ